MASEFDIRAFQKKNQSSGQYERQLQKLTTAGKEVKTH